jgi:multiple sugar transport system permease protein
MSRFARLPPTARVVLFLTVALPFALATLLATARYGSERRQAALARLLDAADSLVNRTTALSPAEIAPALLAAARKRGLAAAVFFRAGDDFRPFDAGPGGSATASLSAGETSALLARDRSVPARPRGGRLAALTPIRDSLQWEITGALLVADTATAPPPVPALPAAADGGGYRFWAVALFAAWAVIAAIGLSLVRLASRPLDLRQGVTAWWFLAPSFAHLLLFSIGPILLSLWLSFHEWDLIGATRPFVGLANYAELARDGGFWRAVGNTAVYVLFVPIGMVVALALALLLDRGMPGERVLRAVFFLPYITSFVAISLVWKWMYDPDVGLLNTVLRTVGLPEQAWLASPRTALPSLMLMSVWMYCGYMMVLFLAGLQSIPETLYESARMDGASAWQRFRRITLPLLRPTTFFVLVTMIIFMFQVFTAVYVMTEGGPLHATDVIVYHIYRSAWEYLRLGYASAMAWVLFAMVFLITLVQFRYLGRGRTQW